MTRIVDLVLKIDNTVEKSRMVMILYGATSMGNIITVGINRSTSSCVLLREL